MKHASMTGLVSAFARAYHAEHNEVKIFDDPMARTLLTDGEFAQISSNMAAGIPFFNPSFSGGSEAALRWVVDHQLSPTPLGRAAFAEKSLEAAVRIGAKQYLILGAGYDTFALRQPKWAAEISIFEMDHPAMIQDKRIRLERMGIAPPKNVCYIRADLEDNDWIDGLDRNPAFHREPISFCSILGVVYYLSKKAWVRLVSLFASRLPKGSSLVFDYPENVAKTDDRSGKQSQLAEAANETMLAGYSYREMEAILSANGFLVYEHLTAEEMTQQYFAAYNKANPAHPMTAIESVNYLLAVKE